MASEIFRERQLANFKPSRSERLKAKRNRDPRADREGNSEAHLAAIRKLPCCIPGCNKVGCDPHHLKAGTGERGMALRSSDRFTVPLCRPHHDEVERISSRGEPAWFAKHGIDPINLAGALWAASPDAAAMTKIVLAHKGVTK